MLDLYLTAPDFEAEITILAEKQSGRQTPPQNYVRWDFGYAEDNPLVLERNLDAEIYMIWPNFLDGEGTPIQKGIPLVGTYKACMHILVREMVDYHQKRISVGMHFNCHEGSRVVAKGVVTQLRAISRDGS
ncbi:MAG: hypothetical protein GYB53_19825 [Rhodobacteraceae bacterium]|nr:hypothetical protein [Paracoccaceae bacterium]MBR9823965.1 hypothetical protein [Paracoccaceae bacterium]